jgi:hypothetical protein
MVEESKEEGISFKKMTCPKCQNENVSQPINKSILLISIVIFVVADIFYSIWGYIESEAFYLIIIINALLTAWFSIYFRKYKCHNCGFKWKDKKQTNKSKV